MEQNDILMLGLGLKSPWKLVNQNLDTDQKPHELQLQVGTDRGTKFACPQCGQACSVHDYKTSQWRHLNFFQHHCYITAKVPRVKCPEHGVHKISVPWARKGSGFTLLFEQAVLMLVRQMPVHALAQIIEETDQRLWRIVHHYVDKAVDQFDLSDVRAVGLDETASKRGQNYVSVYIDMERKDKPVLFATPGKGKATVACFADFMKDHQGDPLAVEEAVCDMSAAFLSGIKKSLPNAHVTVDWFHIVQTFTKAVDKVRQQELRIIPMPKGTRWAVLKRADHGKLTDHQVLALQELLDQGLDTAVAWQIKERLRWIRLAKTPQAARWRITRFINHATELLQDSELLEPMLKAVQTLKRHIDQVVRRWTSTFTNARMEGLNSLFQAAKARARGYRLDRTFISMIYLIASPAGIIMEST
jgi:transposase